jgi:hypothetical protein
MATDWWLRMALSGGRSRAWPSARRRQQQEWAVTWRGVVWREAGNYGAGGTFLPAQVLGDHTFPDDPRVGMILELGGDDYEVVSVDVAYCYVRPTRMKPL